MQKTDTPAPVGATFTEVLCEELCSMEQLEAENVRHLEARRAAVQLWTADIAEVRFKSFDTKASLRDHLRSVGGCQGNA
jgi:antitoxin ParD1/3/4